VPAHPHLAVTCLTCGSRLRVVDRQLIGSIANCPKCGAMVEIKPDPMEPPTASEDLPDSPDAQRRGTPPLTTHMPPQAVSPPERKLSVGDRAGIDSEALTQSSVTTPDELAMPPASEGAEFQPSDWDRNDHSALAPVAGTAAATPVQLPVDPSSIWQSASSRKVSQLALVITLAGFGLIAATVGFIQFARSFTPDQGPVVAVENSEQRHADTVSPEAELTEMAPPAAVLPAPDSASQPQAADTVPDSEPTDSAIGNSATAPDRNAIAAANPPQLPLPGSIPVPASPGQTDPVGPAITAENFLPEGGPNPMDDLPMGLRKFVPLLDVSTADNGAPQIFETPPTIDSVRLDAAAGDAAEETPTAKRPSIDLTKALSMRFAIDHAGATLSELMLLISQLTAVPIELELISIDVAGVSVNQPLKTPAGWLTAGQWLEQSLGPAGLAYEITDDRVLVFATAQQLIANSGSALQLNDFGDDAAEVAQWLQPIVTPLTPVGDDHADEQEPQNPDPQNANPPVVAWSFDAQQQALVVPLDRFLLVQSICAVEALRMMREMPPRLPRQQTARWVGRWSSSHRGDVAGQGKEDDEAGAGDDEVGVQNANAGPAVPVNPLPDEVSIGDWPLVMEGASGKQVDSPRTLAGLLRRIATDNRAAVVVVWRDAMRHQVYPTDLAMPLNEGKSAGALLDELIGESGLQARDAGDAVWWIGSEGLYDRYEIITWIKIPSGSGEAIAGRLARAIGVNDPSQLPIAWDDSTLMIRAPRYIARQLPRFLKP